MSRIAKAPIPLETGVDVTINGQSVTVKGPKGVLSLNVHSDVIPSLQDGVLGVKPVAETKSAWAMAGTMRALLNNMVIGVTKGFEKKMQLIGVGYRAQSKGKILDLSLGFSHPISYAVPDGIQVETPTQTEIVVSGIDKHKVGHVAAQIRDYRPPEPYKGKGVRYVDEYVIRKEAKKK